MEKNLNLQIQKEVLVVAQTLQNAGFEAYLIGGCVRDLIMARKPTDWDITTQAKPEEITKLFPKTFYENEFGTVSVVNEETADETLKVVEVTPYRLEAKYSNKRHPDSVSFSDKLEDDLKRRDFTINAIAYRTDKGQIVDLHGGLKDIKDKIVRAVGSPQDRFNEDALRIMRAVRIAAELDFNVSRETSEAIKKTAKNLKEIAAERLQMEFFRIINSKNPQKALMFAHEHNVLTQTLPELEEGVGCFQGGAHKYDVFEHNLRALQHAADKNYMFHVKLSALLHDIGKPRTRRPGQAGKKEWTFYGHEVVGAKMTKEIMRRLNVSRETSDLMVKLVRNHLFFSDPEKITLSAVRRIVAKMGPEYVWDLMKVRICDRVGMGRPKEEPYRLRKYEAMIEQVMRDPISVKKLAINGHRLKDIGIEPGPEMGWILHALLEEVLEEPAKNTPEYLEKRASELIKLPKKELEKLGKTGKEKTLEQETKEIEKIRGRWGVK